MAHPSLLIYFLQANGIIYKFVLTMVGAEATGCLVHSNIGSEPSDYGTGDK